MNTARSWIAIGCLFLATNVQAAEEFGGGATWAPPAAAVVREQVLSWLNKQKLKEPARAELVARWPVEDAATPEARLQRLAETFVEVDPRYKKLVDVCGGPPPSVILPEFTWLTEEETPVLVRNNLRLYYARWMVSEDLYDEAVEVFAGLKPEDVIDPASLLFYHAVANHQIVNTDVSQKLATKLLQRDAELPRRFTNLAQLMRSDTEGIKHDSLDHISRRMDDIRRRLDLGRAGDKVRGVEDGVIASLDKLIKELEDQQKQQQSSSSSGGAQSGTPMQDSQIAGQKGPGKVDSRDIGSKSGWGDLPPKEREAALQQIGKQFPPYYRDAIEQFFRKIASEEETD